MADNSRTVMTDAGFALEAKVRADETKMQFTRATISTDDHFDDADDALAKLGTLDNVQQDGAITDVKVIDDTTVHVQVDVDQTKAPADYAMLSAGLYARDGDDNEILYGVIVLKDPAYVHKDDDGSYLGFGIDTVVGRAANVTIAVSPANVVTQQAFSSVMADYYDKTAVENLLKNYVSDDDFASNLPQNIATTDAANTFAKSQTLAGGATDGKGNAYATTKDVSTALNNGLSTKVTDNHDNTITANNLTYDLSKTGLTPLGIYKSGSFNDLPLGTVFTDPPIADGPDTIHSFTTTTFFSSEWGGRKAQIAITDNENLMYFRVESNSSWNNWTLLSDDSKVVHSTDMRKLASDVAGIEEVNAKQDKIGYTPADDSKVVHSTLTELNSTDMNTVLTAGFYRLISGTNGMPNADEWTIYQVIPLADSNGVQVAYETNNAILGMRSWNSYNHFTGWVQFADDSKVAHLSGANNFDTVPTVNNNSLLLASSLPSDLARTGSNQEFTGKNTFDTALIDKTTGNPYITKSDVTTAVSAVNANMVHRNPDTGVVSEPVDFTNLTVNGGKTVATSDDLKSIWLTMWHEIELPDMFTGSPILMKYNSVDQTTMILGAKNATLADGASWTGTLFTLPEGFHWITTDSKMTSLYNMASYNDNVSGRLYNTKLSRNGSSSDGSKFGIWFTALSRSIISIDQPYTVVNSIQPD